ncbi:hypothetical protein MNBD_GAMMA23-326, partial [hydrothermal vent metagenome]
YYLFEYIRPQALYPQIDFLPWAQLFLILTLISLFNDKSIKSVGNPLNKLFVLFIIIVILSSLAAYDPWESWKYKNIMLSWIIVYYLTINIVNTEKRFFLFLLVYLLFNLKMGQHGAVDWIGRGLSFADYGLIGSPGWFRNSGEYAIQMMIFGSLAIAFVVSLKEYWGKYKKFIMYGAAATGYLAVVGASSRGSQLGLLLIFILFSLRSKAGIKGLLGVTVLGLLLYNILPDEQMARFQEMGDDRTSLQRLAYWKVGLDLIADNPLLGIGYKNWMVVVSGMFPDGIPPLNVVQVPHSIYIEAAAELGIFAFFVFLIMVVYAFVINSKTRKMLKGKTDKLLFNVTYGLDAGLLGFLVAGAFVTVLTYPFFWIQIAMIVTVNNIVKNKYPVEKVKRRGRMLNEKKKPLTGQS